MAIKTSKARIATAALLAGLLAAQPIAGTIAAIARPTLANAAEISATPGDKQLDTIVRIKQQLETAQVQINALKANKQMSDADKQKQIDQLNLEITKLNAEFEQLTVKANLESRSKEIKSQLDALKQGLGKCTFTDDAKTKAVASTTLQVDAAITEFNGIMSNKQTSDGQKQTLLEEFVSKKFAKLSVDALKLINDGTSIEQQLNQLEKKVAELEKKTNECKFINVDRVKELENVKAQIAGTKQYIANLLKDKKQSAADKQKAIAALEQHISGLNAKVELLADHSSIEAQLAQLNVTVQQLETQLKDCDFNDSAKSTEVATAQKELKAINAEIMKILNDSKSSATDQQKAVDAVTHRVTSVKATVAELSKAAKQDVNALIKELESKLDAVQSKADAIEFKSEPKTKELSNAKQALASLKDQLSQLRKDGTKSNADKKSDCKTIEKKINEQEKKVDVLKKESAVELRAAKIADALDALQHRADAIKTDAKDKQEALDKAKLEIAEARTQLHDILNDQKSSSEDKTKALDELDKKTLDIDAQLQKIEDAIKLEEKQKSKQAIKDRVNKAKNGGKNGARHGGKRLAQTGDPVTAAASIASSAGLALGAVGSLLRKMKKF